MELFKNIIWGFCRWEVVVIFFWVAAVAGFAIQRHRLKKKIREIKDQL